MSERINTLIDFSNYVFERLDRTLGGLTENELEWHPVDGANNIQWILNHISRIINVITMIYIKGDPNYSPEGWPDNYREQKSSLQRYLKDIEKGKKKVLNGIGALTPEYLMQEVTRRGTTRTRQLGLFIMLSEVVHHGGQIAYIRGTINRRREKEPNFLI